MRKFLFAGAALALLGGSPLIAHAQSMSAAAPAMADMGTPSATFVFLPQVGNANMGSATGSSGGIGTLSFNGKRYSFTAAGVSAGRMGTAPGPISGEIYNLKDVKDINGGYTAEMMPGDKEAILKNAKGVAIHLMANSGLAMSVGTVGVRLN